MIQDGRKYCLIAVTTLITGPHPSSAGTKALRTSRLRNCDFRLENCVSVRRCSNKAYRVSPSLTARCRKLNYGSSFPFHLSHSWTSWSCPLGGPCWSFVSHICSWLDLSGLLSLSVAGPNTSWNSGEVRLVQLVCGSPRSMWLVLPC